MSHQFSHGGFNVRSAPGGTHGYDQPMHDGASYQDYRQTIGPAPGENEEDVRHSTAGRQVLFGGAEIFFGLLSNAAQMMTTIFSFIQLQLGVKTRIYDQYGMWGGLAYASAHNPAYVWISFTLAIGAQLLLQAGFQVLAYSWKQGQVSAHQGQRHHAFVKVLVSKKAGYFFTGLGFILDVVGDVGFAIAFNVPGAVCVLFGLITTGVSTYVLYDGDERFHFAYPIWWAIRTAKKAWNKAALEAARLAHGVNPDGRSLVRVVSSQR